MPGNQNELLNPSRIWSRTEVFNQKPCPIPAESGVYAWYFKHIPSIIPKQDCHQHNNFILLYVGIAPSRPTSSSNLRKRIKQHYRGNAYGSTLRLSLGCLLAEELDIELRCVGGGKRQTFGPGETKLSNWMEQNAFVTWTLQPEPGLLEDELIQQLSLPLNLRSNENHPFHPQLTAIRSQAKTHAKELPVHK
ncbi:MAG: GIY-YIG nuclease family protein [Anaerolineales bacterium]|nr:GIY-YIG nuclease family protein [Anaerolineales bacterium]